MAIRVPWDEHETALLIESCQKYDSGVITKKEVIRGLSTTLRNRAAQKGIEIDDVFRNENGIAMQFSIISSLIHHQKSGLHGASKLFKDMAELYNNDRLAFDKILMEAKNMADNESSMQNQYISWLSTQVSPDQMSELYFTYSEVESFCRHIKVLKKPLFETTDIKTVAAVKQTIESNMVFRFKHKSQLQKMSSAMKYYYSWIKDNQNPLSEEAVTSTLPDDTEIIVPIQNRQENISDKNDPLKSTNVEYLLFVDFRKPTSYAFTSTEYFQYFGERYDEINNWTHLYIQLLQCLLKNYSNIIYDLKGCSLSERGRVDISGSAGICRMAAPKQFADGLYVETNLSASNIVDKIRLILDKCNVDYDNIVIAYTAKKDSAQKDESVVPTRRRANSADGADFFDWLTTVQGMSKNTGHNYVSAVAGCEKYAKEHHIEPWQLYKTDDAEVVKTVVSTLMGDDDFCSYNAQQHNRFSAALRRFLEYHTGEPLVTAQTNSYSKGIIHCRRNNSASNEFYTWLTQVQGMATTTARSYCSAINNCESFSKEHNLDVGQFYGANDFRVVKEASEVLMSNAAFRDYNDQQRNRFRAAMKKYVEFISGDKDTICTAKDEPQVDLTQYEELLFEKYQKGFRIESSLEMRRFRNFWEIKYSAPLEETDETMRKYIRRLTIQHKDFVYLPEAMVDAETQQRLLAYIEHCFSNGKNAIYYDALYKEFEIEFQRQRVNNADMLKTYLDYTNEGNYVINRGYLATDRSVEVDPTDEVRDYVITYGAPMQTDDLLKALSQIPRDKIIWAVAGSNSAEFVRNQKGEYFHADIVDLTTAELDNITDLIQNAINEKDFIGGNELIETISAKYPSILERYPYLTQLGMRDVIGYKLRDVFSFKGKIISALGEDLSMSDVFADYAKSHAHFTITQLNALKTELDTPIYFDSVYRNSLRIDKENFVSKEQANFDSIATDAAIDRFCVGDYITISEIRLFGSFPYACFPWNGFLLEHYVSDYSKTYKLLHAGFNAGTPVGAIVKRTSKFENFDELITSALADSTISLNKQDALQYLCDNGFLVRRSYAAIEQILVNANAQRSQKG
ncbi:site-specific integrase [Desulfosporosinus lacus]|uniref:Phage integrase, N-terminal SAM-like domain n=1 Tax=Desulfosporosinus lacus DSM 15449 TaxID=1121420 RepID=A0A1M5ZXZ3_9FIRM|nr:site-specific integrase [Desulfosporosinus lacus]SHI29134.1 Phage integrase, N-terminal SAM-like domain [Desulfosporosinus lacus DSM 15449]